MTIVVHFTTKEAQAVKDVVEASYSAGFVRLSDRGAILRACNKILLAQDVMYVTRAGERLT